MSQVIVEAPTEGKLETELAGLLGPMREAAGNNLDEAMQLQWRAEELVEQMPGNSLIKAEAYLTFGRVYRRMGGVIPGWLTGKTWKEMYYQTSLGYGSKAEGVCQGLMAESDDEPAKRMLAKALAFQGLVYTDLGKYDLALEEYVAAWQGYADLTETDVAGNGQYGDEHRNDT